VQGDKRVREPRGWGGSKAKVGGKRMGFLGGSTKRLLTNPTLMAMRLGNRRAERAGRVGGSPVARETRGQGNNRRSVCACAGKESGRWGMTLLV
jgi:hypothetical protein